MDAAVLAFWARRIVSGLVIVPAGPLLLMVLGLWLGRWRRTFGLSLVAIGLLVLTVFSLPIVANAIARPAERAYPPLGADIVLPKDAAIVVLGGGTQQGATDYGGETVNITTLARLRSAARLAARTHLPILVSGGRLPLMETTEGEQMAASLSQDFHTPVRWIEKASLDTQDNARLSVTILKPAGVRTAILVTDVGHMARSRALFEAEGMAVIAAPTDYYANTPISVLTFIPNAGALRRSSWTLYEWLGGLWNRVGR